MKRLSISVLLVFVCAIFGFAQIQKDFELWTGVDLEKELIEDLKVEVEIQTRTHQNSSRLDEYLNDFTLEYKISSRFDVSAGYRIGTKNDEDLGFTTLHRFDANFMYDNSIGEFTFDYRLRYTHGFEGIRTTEEGIVASRAWRQKLKIEMDMDDELKDFTPEVFTEVFHSLEAPYRHYIDKIRIGFGLDYKINKNNDLSASFMRQSGEGERSFVLGFGYSKEF